MKKHERATRATTQAATAKIFFFIALFLVLMVTCADICLASPSDTTLVSEIVTKFHDKLSTYEAVMLKYARLLFYWCVTLEIAWLGIKKALGSSEIAETLKEFCFILLSAGFFLAVINNYHDWSWSIIRGMQTIAGEATTLIDASDRPFSIGLKLAQSIFSKISAFSPLDTVAYILCGMAILLCFALITMQIILIKCECIVAMCAASVLLGLGATAFFRDYAINALRYIFSVAFKLMTMQLVMGVGINFIMDLEMADSLDWGQLGVTLSFCVIFYCLVKSLPETVSGIIQGSHIGSGNALSSTVASLGAGLAGAGMAAGAGMLNVGRAAMAAKAQGATGFGGMVRGTTKNLWEATRESMHNRDAKNNTVSTGLRQRIEAARLKAPKANT